MLCNRIIKPKPLPIVIENEFIGAGCLFTNHKHVLAGYHHRKTTPFIGGFGGKKEKNEVYEETAIREMVEELFNVTNVSFTLIINIKKIIPLKTLHHNNYYILVYTFDDLLTILAECNKFIKSDLYEIMPDTVEKLIFNRLYNEKSEISTLCLLPKSKFLKIEKDFAIDVGMI
jgi:hypothetical protein